ncbi:hypothetical protein BJ944DRAFT_266947 [Cunninghamella echinulata]|nr:hypothetical protein BJ944DRAFT_266947 [Cunninghamella echinulata]
MANVSKNKKTAASSNRLRGRLQKAKASSPSKNQEEENKTPHYRTRRRTVKKYQDDMSDVEYESKITEESNSSDQETSHNKLEDMETNKNKDNTKVDKEIEEADRNKTEKEDDGGETANESKVEDEVEDNDDKVYGSPKEEDEEVDDDGEEEEENDDDDDDDDGENEDEDDDDEDSDDKEFEQEEESSEDEYGLPTLNRKRKLNADKSPSPPPLPSLSSYPKSPPKKRKLRPQNNNYMPKVALNLVDEDDLDLQYNETKYTNRSHSNHSAVILGSPTKLRSVDKQQHLSANTETTLVATSSLSPSDNCNIKKNTITKDKSYMSVDDVFESTEIKHQDEDKRQHKKRKDISTQVLDKLGKQIVNDQLDFSQHSFIPTQYNSITMHSSITSSTANDMKENDQYDSICNTNDDDDIIMDKVDQEGGYSEYNKSINMQQNDPRSDKETNKNADNSALSNNIPNISENGEDNTQPNEKPGFFKKLLRFFFS